MVGRARAVLRAGRCRRPVDDLHLQHRTLARALQWIQRRFAGVPLVLGGQFSNLKAAEILRRFDTVDYVIRGDGEVALPALLHALEAGSSVRSVPNLVMRDPATGELARPPSLTSISIVIPRPPFHGDIIEIPYESMRGCPFSCKFCSYPAASPEVALEVSTDHRS